MSPTAFADDPEHVLPDTGLPATIDAGDIVIAIIAAVLSI